MSLKIAKIRLGNTLSKLDLAWIDEYVANDQDFYLACKKVPLSKTDPIREAIPLCEGRGRELIALLVDEKANRPNDVGKAYIEGKLVDVIEKVSKDGEFYDASNVIKAATEVNKMQGNLAPVNVRVETTLDIIGYDFSAMNKPKIIEAEVTKSIPASIDFALPPNYITAREEFANV